MYRNERILLDRYDAQVPRAVAEQIVTAAGLLSHTFDGLTERRRVGGHHTLHELTHHLADVDRILRGIAVADL